MMVNLFGFLFLISIILFILGIINPQWVPLFIKGQKTRKRATIFYGIAIIVFFILIGITAPSSQTVNKNTSTVSSTEGVKKPSPTKPSDTPTPTSTDPCHEYQGTDKWQECNQLNIATSLGAEPKLDATVRFENTYLSITNNTDIEWDGCIAYIPNYLDKDPYYNTTGIVIKPHQTGEIAWADLTRDSGERFNYYTTKPQSIQLICNLKTTGKEANKIFFPQ